MTADQILTNLDNYKTGYYCHFIDLGNGYSYLIDCRLNIFEDGDDWAIAAERLGFNPRRGCIELNIYYYGNCLTNLEHYNGQDTNYYTVFPVDDDDFWATTDGAALTGDGSSWRVRGQQVEINHQREDYAAAGIKLKEYEPGEILIQEVARLLVGRHSELFRATDEELYKSLPAGLKKRLVLDQWYHRDFNEIPQPTLGDEQLRSVFAFNKDSCQMTFEDFAQLYREQEQRTQTYNQDQRQDNRPSGYETWQLIAKVIATGDPAAYRPTLIPNTHWKFWPDSGSL
jgi:hypothetical protein